MMSGFIYLILSDDQDAGKVGWSRTYPADRLTKAQTSNPSELELETVIRGGRQTEAAIHELLRDRHIRGEWFRDTEFLVPFFGALHEAGIDSDDNFIEVTPDAAKECFAAISNGHLA